MTLVKPALLAVVAAALHLSPAMAQELEFPAAAASDTRALDRAIPGLARQAMNAYPGIDSLRRTLGANAGTCDRGCGDVFRLQLASGDFAGALATLDAVRRLSSSSPRRSAQSARSAPSTPRERADPALIALEIFAAARLSSANAGVDFATAYSRAFRDVFARLDNREAVDASWYMETPAFVFERNLGSALESLEGASRISQPAALGLIRAYLAHQANVWAEPHLAALIQTDEQARYEFADHVAVETPDGATLTATVVRPRNLTEPGPAALNFTIYADDARHRQVAKTAAARGYVGVVATSRGKRLSTDEIRPYEHEASDTHAVIDWISRQGWSNGEVGMYGGSFDGFAAWAATKRLHPALKTIVPYAAAIPGQGLPMENNVFLSANYAWSFYVGNNRYLDEETYSQAERWRALTHDWYESGRPYRMIDSVDGTPNPHLQRWLDHPAYDSYWQSMVPYGEDYASIDIPVLSITGYYDDGQISALHYFREHYRYNPGAEHYLLIGPYDHFGAQARRKPLRLRGYEVDSVANFDTEEITFQWLDHVLRGGARPELIEDRINYQVMGTNTWQHAPSLDAMRTESYRLYLTSDSAGRDMRLSQARPSSPGFVRQVVNLADRTTSGNSYYPSEITSRDTTFTSGLTFISEPFAEAVQVNGAFSGNLQVTINKRDLDLNLVLYELLPDGTLFHLSYFLGRASHAADMTTRVLLTPGEVESIPFERTRMVSRQLQAGSRLVVVLDVNRDSFHQTNYGTGRDVSDESVADAGEPLEVLWHNGSYVDIPIRR